MEYNVAVDIVVHVGDMDKFDDILSKFKGMSIQDAKLESVSVEDVGFGIKNIKLFILTFDKEGTMDRIENTVASVPGITYEVTNVTRI